MSAITKRIKQAHDYRMSEVKSTSPVYPIACWYAEIDCLPRSSRQGQRGFHDTPSVLTASMHHFVQNCASWVWLRSFTWILCSAGFLVALTTALLPAHGYSVLRTCYNKLKGSSGIWTVLNVVTRNSSLFAQAQQWWCQITSKLDEHCMFVPLATLDAQEDSREDQRLMTCRHP